MYFNCIACPDLICFGLHLKLYINNDGFLTINVIQSIFNEIQYFFNRLSKHVFESKALYHQRHYKTNGGLPRTAAQLPLTAGTVVRDCAVTVAYATN